MKKHLCATFLSAALLASSAPAQQAYYPPSEANGGWRSLITPGVPASPAERAAVLQVAGMDWAAIEKAWQRVAPHGGSLVVIRRGWVVGEWGPSTPYHVASVAKSFTAMAMMRLFDQSDAGQLAKTIGEKDHAADYLPPVWLHGNPAKAGIQVEHLMTMTSGLAFHDSPKPSSSYLSTVLNQKTAFAPKTVWTYSSQPVDLLSLIVTDVTGKKLRDYFRFQIGARIGMAPMVWQSMGSYTVGSAWAYTTPRDGARLVYLLLRDGRWMAPSGLKQILSPARAGQLTKPSPLTGKTAMGTPNSIFVPNAKAHVAYGRLFWTDARDKRLLGWRVPRDAFYMAGFGTNLVLGVPSEDLIVVRMGSFPRPWDTALVRGLTDDIMKGIL